MKNLISIFSLLVLFFFRSYSQNNYINYYRQLYQGNVDLAFNMNKPLPNDLFARSIYYFKSKQFHKGKKFLKKAAIYGFNYTECIKQPFMDSILSNNMALHNLVDKSYRIFITRICDFNNSVLITKLFENDQNIRRISNYNGTDSLLRKYLMAKLIECDSINYYSLLKIIKEPTFISTNLTLESKLGLGIILAHSATNNYANADSVFQLLKNEMLKGVVSPLFYSNSVDRYYMYNKKMNYYCQFFDEDFPIYDIINIDKRREEIGLPSLYQEFKSINKLNELPKDYKYDNNSVKY
jgi:hypothetical protein